MLIEAGKFEKDVEGNQLGKVVHELQKYDRDPAALLPVFDIVSADMAKQGRSIEYVLGDSLHLNGTKHETGLLEISQPARNAKLMLSTEPFHK